MERIVRIKLYFCRYGWSSYNKCVIQSSQNGNNIKLDKLNSMHGKPYLSAYIMLNYSQILLDIQIFYHIPIPMSAAWW